MTSTKLHRIGQMLIRVARRYAAEDASTLAAGIALFSLMALPAVVVGLVAVYGLITSPGDIAGQVDWLSRLLPGDLVASLHRQMDRAARTSSGTLSLAAIAAVGFALTSLSTAVSATISGLNRIYRRSEQRRFLRRLILAFAIAVIGFVLALLGLALLVGLPEIAGRLGWEGGALSVLRGARWPLAFVGLAIGLTAFYRVAPSGSRISIGDAALGGVLAAVLLLVASLALSWFAGHVVNYDALYGAFGGVLVVMLWAYLSASALVIGGLASSEITRTR